MNFDVKRLAEFGFMCWGVLYTIGDAGVRVAAVAFLVREGVVSWMVPNAALMLWAISPLFKPLVERVYDAVRGEEVNG